MLRGKYSFWNKEGCHNGWVWLSRIYLVNRWSAFFAKVTVDSKAQWWADPSNKAAGGPRLQEAQTEGPWDGAWTLGSRRLTSDLQLGPSFSSCNLPVLAWISSRQMSYCRWGSSLQERRLCGSQARESCYPCRDRGSWQSCWGGISRHRPRTVRRKRQPRNSKPDWSPSPLITVPDTSDHYYNVTSDTAVL